MDSVGDGLYIVGDGPRVVNLMPPKPPGPAPICRELVPISRLALPPTMLTYVAGAVAEEDEALTKYPEFPEEPVETILPVLTILTPLASADVRDDPFTKGFSFENPPAAMATFISFRDMIAFRSLTSIPEIFLAPKRQMARGLG